MQSIFLNDRVLINTQRLSKNVDSTYQNKHFTLNSSQASNESINHMTITLRVFISDPLLSWCPRTDHYIEAFIFDFTNRCRPIAILKQLLF